MATLIQALGMRVAHDKRRVAEWSGKKLDDNALFRYYIPLDVTQSIAPPCPRRVSRKTQLQNTGTQLRAAPFLQDQPRNTRQILYGANAGYLLTAEDRDDDGIPRQTRALRLRLIPIFRSFHVFRLRQVGDEHYYQQECK